MYWPVRTQARFEQQMAVVTKASVKRTSSLANRSVWEVRMRGLPMAPRQNGGWSSVKKNRKFGRPDSAPPAGTISRPISDTATGAANVQRALAAKVRRRSIVVSPSGLSPNDVVAGLWTVPRSATERLPFHFGIRSYHDGEGHTTLGA